MTLAAFTSLRAKATVAAIVLTATTLAATGPVSTPAGAKGRYSQKVRHPARGLTFIKMHDSQGPNKIRILKVDPSSQMTLDVALSNDSLPGRETTSSMVAKHGAIAGINASFGNSWGRPLGIFAEDGLLKASPYSPGGNFAISQGDHKATVGHYPLKIRGRTVETGAKWRVKDWNDPNENRERIAGFTHAGGDAIKPSTNSCAMRLLPRGPYRWGRHGKDVGRRYKVAKVACADPRMPLHKGLVLAAKRGTQAGLVIAAHLPGQHVNLSWSVGIPGVMDAVGGTPVLLQDGVVLEDCSGYVCQQHPRTGVGVLPNGKVLLVTVDGRSSSSVGLNIFQFAHLMKHLGATDAVNLDGGGSTTMVLKGRIVNHPSDGGGEREVSSSIIVLKGPDSGEPSPKGTLPGAAGYPLK